MAALPLPSRSVSLLFQALAGPARAEQTPYERAVATCEREQGTLLAPAQRLLLQRLSADVCTLIAEGHATLASVEASAAHELAASWGAADCYDDDENEELLKRLAAEEEEEAQALDAQVAKMRLNEAPSRPVATTFLQRRRLSTGESVPSVAWQWRTTSEGGAWYAEPCADAPRRDGGAAAGPDMHPPPVQDHLRVAFISDTHGCHGLLERWWANLGEVDVLVLCGDCWEHEGQTEEERGPSLLDDLQPPVSRDLAEWLLSLDVKYKICISGNHDGPFARAETAALRGVPAPWAGDPAREYLAGRGSPCLYLQDEACVIPLGDGRSLIIHGTPWQSDIGGLFQYGLRALVQTGVATGKPHSRSFGALSTSMEGNVSTLVEGPWGVGDRAHIVLSHGPPKHILDTVNGGFATSDDPNPKGLKPVGCTLLLNKLRRVKPLVAAWGHVHAEQGMAWLAWKKTAAAKAWRKAGRAAMECGAPYPAPPPGAPRRGSLRVVEGRDLSQVHASKLPFEEALDSEAGEQLTRSALEEDFAHTLFVNAASLNATISTNQHGLRFDRGLMQMVRCERTGPGLDKAKADSRLRTLRPPIIVDVFPEREGEPRECGRAVLVPLGIERFPE